MYVILGRDFVLLLGRFQQFLLDFLQARIGTPTLVHFFDQNQTREFRVNFVLGSL